ncbi:MAG: ABC transporter ATP-binding protein [Dehalococcoidia bacterium]|nr:ABC transporter ATP-binding protein [Dehalococcoidia bacterium]
MSNKIISAAEYAVETFDLAKSFGSYRALRGVNLQVQQGLALAILGPNGAGKTTLIKLLSGIMRPSKGRIMIDGLDSRENSLEVRERLGLVAHQSYLYSNLSAEENLDFYARMYGVPNRQNRVSDVLKLVGLDMRRHDRFSTFSRGMQQRLSLARALLHEPSLLLLDEPETGLDQQGLDAIWSILKSEGEKRTIIFSSHNFERALSMCDGVVILAHGRIVFQERACNLDMQSLRHKYLEYTQTVTL